jgi:hypothetical protein
MRSLVPEANIIARRPTISLHLFAYCHVECLHLKNERTFSLLCCSIHEFEFLYAGHLRKLPYIRRP